MQTTTIGELVETIKARINEPGFSMRHILSPQYYYLVNSFSKVPVFNVLSTIYNIESSTGDLDTFLVSGTHDIHNRRMTWQHNLNKDTKLVQLPHLPRKLLMHLEDGNWAKTKPIDEILQQPNYGGKYRFHGEFEPLPILGARLEVKYFNMLTQRPLTLAAYVECKDTKHAEKVISDWVANGAETILTYGHLTVPSLDTIYICREVSGWVHTMTAGKFYPE